MKGRGPNIEGSIGVLQDAFQQWMDFKNDGKLPQYIKTPADLRDWLVGEITANVPTLIDNLKELQL